MATLDDPRAPPVGTILDGRYQLVRFLAQGGMGAVYEALGPDGARLAVKVLLDSSKASRQSGAWARFVREAQVSSSLSSPHIVKVSGGGIDPERGTGYLAMEYLVGEDLESLLERTGPLHPQVAVRLIVQAARGIAVAHEAGIVHRDVKPSNLFLEQRAGEVTVKVCDFGVAKVHPNHDQQHLTGTGHVLGSPMYMAPEQVLSSKRVDGRADVWALGMSLYHALAGQPALSQHDSFPGLVLALTTEPIPPLQQQAPWVSPGLAALVHGALLRDVEQRCPSVDALIQALLPHAGGNDDVTAGMLVGVPAELRSEAAPLAAPPSSWTEAGELNKEADPLIGKKLANRYELVALLGEGGMGAVYEARTEQGESVACKVIRPDLVGSSPDAMRRLMREARTAMKLEDPHVVRMSEVDTDMSLGLPFIAMELLRGVDLSEMLRGAGPLSPPAVCRLFIDACKGISAAHRQGIIHRDIKPANIFLHQPSGPSGPVVVKLCDFGIAKQTDVDGYGKTSTELTRTGGLLGSPLYMSPEQARNAKGVDHRTDIWSLAMSMFEALAGQKAWHGFSSPGELVLAICTQDVRPLQDIAPWVPAEIADAVHRGLRRDPSERFPSIEAFAAALEAHAVFCPSLTLDALRSLTSAQRSVIAERSPHSRRSPPSVSSADSTRDVDMPEAALASASASAPPTPPRTPPLRLLAGATLATLALGGSAWVAVRGASTREATASVVVSPAIERTSPPLPSVSPVTALLVARVQVSPPGATVTVNGRPSPVVDGSVEIQGEAGESFLVVVEVDGARREARVVLTKDGIASPASIEGPARTAKADPNAKSSGKAPAGKASSAAAAPPATAAATKTDPPSGIGPQKDWR